MPRFIGYYLLVLVFLSVGCATPTPTPTPRSLGGVADTTAANTPIPPTAVPAPQVQLTAATAPPGQELGVLGTAFPPHATIEIALQSADAPPRLAVVMATAEADELGHFAATFTLPLLWPGTDPTAESAPLLIRATSRTIPAYTAETPLTLDYREAFRLYENSQHGFSIPLPAAWVIEGPLLTPLGTMYLAGQEPIEPGNPAVSTFMVAPAQEWTAHRAAEQLLCGGGCLDEVRFTLTTVNDMPARQLVIQTPGVPPLTWYFVERDRVLLYFSLHDPITFATLDPLVQALLFEPATAVASTDPTPAPASTSTPTASPTPTPTLEPTAEPTAEPTPLPTPTPAATPDLREVGPVQMVIDLLTGILRQDIFSVAEVEYRFTQDYLASNDPRPLLLNALQVGQLLKSFNTTRAENGSGVVVQANLVLLDDTRATRLFVMVQEDGVWRIDDIQEAALPTPAPAEPTAEPTPEPTPEPEGDA